MTSDATGSKGSDGTAASQWNGDAASDPGRRLDQGARLLEQVREPYRPEGDRAGVPG